MTLKLSTLLFDRKTSSSAPAAIPVRVNEASGVPDVDWKRTGTHIDAASVAYPLTMSAGDVGDLRVTVRFTASSAPSGPIFVRAAGQGGRLLGDVVKTRIAAADINGEHQIPLDNVLLRNAAVGQHTVDWKWEQSDDGITWQQFDESAHQVFVTVGRPEAPWGRPDVPHTIVPWHEAMWLACTWANGKRDAMAVMEAITAKVDKLAGTPVGRTGAVVKYGQLGSLIFGGGKLFALEYLLKIVKGHSDMPRRLNCRDLNTAVAINASLLGCPLRVIRLQPVPGTTIGTNPVLLFGQMAAGPLSFKFHEAAAIQEPRIGNRQVWDACVSIDFDSQPQQTPGDFRLPAGVTMHQTAADMGYRKRLLTPGSQNCPVADAEGDGLRYPNAHPIDRAAFDGPDEYFQERREHFAALMGRIPTSLPQPDLPSDAVETFLANNAEAEAFPRSVLVGDQQAALVFTPIRPFTSDHGGLETSVVQAGNRQQAIDLFVTLAAEYAGTLEQREFGDFALHDPRFDAVLMLRGSIVAEINGDAGPDAAPSALFEASRLDDALNQFFTPPSV